ncbi:MAG: helix-turn-helix domain-containing protein [Bacteroidota bacterium]
MIQKIYIPNDPKLRQIVNFMSYVEITPEDAIEGWTAMFPNATSNLFISLSDKIAVDHTTTDSAIYVSCSRTTAFKPFIGFAFIAVQFNSYGMFYLKGIPVKELHNSLVSLAVFFKPSEIERITSRLKESASIYEKFTLLETFLSQQMYSSTIDDRLPFAIASLKSLKIERVEALSEALCLSSRAVHKLFHKHVGLNPVQYKRICRFNQAAQLMLQDNPLNLTSIAMDCGYHDQSHFIRDFRKFSGISPSDFMRLKATSSDFYNFNLKDLGILQQ